MLTTMKRVITLVTVCTTLVIAITNLKVAIDALRKYIRERKTADV